MVNGASLTMPYLEPFLNRTMREASEHIEDDDLKQDINGFVRQEAQHFQNHRRYNEGAQVKWVFRIGRRGRDFCIRL